MAIKPASDVSIGKFDILATCAYAEALRHALDDDNAVQRGMVAGIMGAHARLGIPRLHDECEADKAAAERKKKRIRSGAHGSVGRIIMFRAVG